MSNVKTAKAVSTDINVTNFPEAREAILTLKRNRAEIKRMEAENKLADAILRERAEGRTGVSFIIRGIVAAKLSDMRERRGVDSKLLAQAYPEAYAATETMTSYSILTIS